MFQGACVPGALTAIALGIGIYMSTSQEAGLALTQHLFNAWKWVGFGLVFSALGTGTSGLLILQEFGTRRGRFQICGAVVFLTAIALATWATWDMDYIKADRDLLDRAIDFSIKLRRD